MLYFEKVLFENVLSNRQVYWVKKYNFIWRILMIIYKKNYYSIFCNEIKLNQTFPLPFVLFLKLLAIAGFCLHFFFLGIIKILMHCVCDSAVGVFVLLSLKEPPFFCFLGLLQKSWFFLVNVQSLLLSLNFLDFSGQCSKFAIFIEFMKNMVQNFDIMRLLMHFISITLAFI